MTSIITFMKELAALLIASKEVMGLIKALLLHIREAKDIKERKEYATEIKKQFSDARDRAVNVVVPESSEEIQR